jgi:hypothetical protein
MNIAGWGTKKAVNFHRFFSAKDCSISEKIESVSAKG